MKRTLSGFFATLACVILTAGSTTHAGGPKFSFGGGSGANGQQSGSGGRNMQFQQFQPSRTLGGNLNGVKTTPQFTLPAGQPLKPLAPVRLQQPLSPILGGLQGNQGGKVGGPIKLNPGLLDQIKLDPKPLKPDFTKPDFTKPIFPLDPGLIVGGGKGHGGHGQGGGKGQGGGSGVVTKPFPLQPGCHNKPQHCHWWFDFCHPIVICHPQHYCYCHWNVITCNYVTTTGVIANTRFYLGLSGLVLPGKGLGVETVDAGSPADAAGLKPGMVIIRANGIELLDENAMKAAVAQSNGRLDLIVIPQAGADPVPVTVQLRIVTSAAF